jgi:carbamoyltransferase
MNKYVLGISCYFHDSAVCLVKNGKIVSSVQEERFTGIKNDSSFPYRGIEWCLNINNISISDIKYVIFYEKPLKKFLRILNSSIEHFPKSRKFFVSQMSRWLSEKLWTKTNIIKKINAKTKQIIFCQHHLSHASSIYYSSGLKNATIVVSDGVGEDQSFSVWKANNNLINLIYEIKYPKSLGLFYSTMTSFLGHRINSGENKVMSMSSFGSDKYYNKIKKIINLERENIFSQNFKYFNYQHSIDKSYSDEMINHLGNPRYPEQAFVNDNRILISEEAERFADVAFATQKITEKIIRSKVDFAYKLNPSKNLCLSGGVFLNCVANYFALKESSFTNIYINNCSSDAGGAVGAALWAWNNLIDKDGNNEIQDVYTGPEYSSDEIKDILTDLKVNYIEFTDKQDLLNSTVVDLIDNNIIAWFQGKMEFGPRALGNRSILAQPNNKGLSKKINNIVKKRENYQPFAASILTEEFNKYFVRDNKFDYSYKYMNVVSKCREEFLNDIQGVISIDKTCRVQTIEKFDNLLFYNLIDNYYKKTKLPLLLNTSFNLKGEPIVDNPIKAVSTFFRSKIDILYLGNFKIINDS